MYKETTHAEMQSSLDHSQCLFYFVSLFYFVPQEKNIAVKLARLEPIERQNINKHVWACLRYHQSFLLFLCAHHKTMIMLNIRFLLIAQSSVHNIKTISVLTARHMFNYSVPLRGRGRPLQNRTPMRG